MAIRIDNENNATLSALEVLIENAAQNISVDTTISSALDVSIENALQNISDNTILSSALDVPVENASQNISVDTNNEENFVRDTLIAWNLENYIEIFASEYIQNSFHLYIIIIIIHILLFCTSYIFFFSPI